MLSWSPGAREVNLLIHFRFSDSNETLGIEFQAFAMLSCPPDVRGFNLHTILVQRLKKTSGNKLCSSLLTFDKYNFLFITKIDAHFGMHFPV